MESAGVRYGLMFSRCTAGDATRFQVRSPHEVFDSALDRSGFTRCKGGDWFRAFPRNAPHVDRAWKNFQRLTLPWLRQMAGMEPVPWEATLESVCARLASPSVDWWLTGSAALATRGVAVSPGDLDLVVSRDDSILVGELLLDGLVEPVSPVDWFCASWGRAVLGARVEWVGGVGPRADQPLPTEFGLAAQARLETIRWRDHALRVPPIGLQREVSLRRGLIERVMAIDDWLEN